MKLISLLSVVILLSSCCTKVGSVKIPIPPAPKKPVLSQIQDDKFFTKLPDIYQIIGQRDQVCTAYSHRLINLIEEYNR